MGGLLIVESSIVQKLVKELSYRHMWVFIDLYVRILSENCQTYVLPFLVEVLNWLYNDLISLRTRGQDRVTYGIGLT